MAFQDFVFLEQIQQDIIRVALAFLEKEGIWCEPYFGREQGKGTLFSAVFAFSSFPLFLRWGRQQKSDREYLGFLFTNL